ncbi:TagK domain-containing protein [Burkholderia pyrrocinia]|uniref:TagK domain-containing protein n=1 Tax=Burkholderia pyrrocinia TaxID=60550 RepID=UPI001BCDF031|nr:TagK domain-containing protein [Burkholderia pyrrocinia]QVN23321.1 TagK domain-containing protein [Burkholderia pyrrocinia]
MRSFRQPWRRQPNISHTEPVPDGYRERQTPDAEGPDLPDYEVIDHPDSNDGVLRELGIGCMDGADAPVRTVANADGDDSLVETLHAQYWRALTDPHASVAAELMPPGVEPTPHALAPDSQVDPGARGECDSIEALLCGNHTLEDMFEQLDRHAEHILDDEPVPEILRLFAPPEFHAAAARRGPALPPPLTRREHHALSVDSPLSAPTRKDEG